MLAEEEIAVIEGGGFNGDDKIVGAGSRHIDGLEGEAGNGMVRRAPRRQKKGWLTDSIPSLASRRLCV